MDNQSPWEKYKRVKLRDAPADDERPKTEETKAFPAAAELITNVADPPQGNVVANRSPAPEAQATKTPVTAPPGGGIVPGVVPAIASPQPILAPAKPNPKLITAPEQPTETGNTWVFFLGSMDVDSNPFYGPYGIDFQWAYSRKNPLPEDPRVVVHMHGSGGAVGAMWTFGPSTDGDIEVRTQDAEGYNQDWREWWTFGIDGQPYPGRRIAAMLRFVTDRYRIDVGKRGIVLVGNSMGGSGAVVQTMILPYPWREKIAYSSGRVGAIMPRQIAQRAPGQYATLAPDRNATKLYWDAIDFSIRATRDSIARGVHYRHTFSSDDQFSEGLDGNTQLQFVNLVEQNKISGAFVWVQAGHGLPEPGVNLPDVSSFESLEQDVTLDRAHPAITNSTGNYPVLAADRINRTLHPRGHYNMGITWNHAGIIDDASQIVLPLKYQRRAGLGKDIPDQPQTITVSVTPRRPRNFVLKDSEHLKWSWDGGVLSGVAIVDGDTVTIDSIPLVSGDSYKNLRIFR